MQRVAAPVEWNEHWRDASSQNKKNKSPHAEAKPIFLA